MIKILYILDIDSNGKSIEKFHQPTSISFSEHEKLHLLLQRIKAPQIKKPQY